MRQTGGIAVAVVALAFVTVGCADPPAPPVVEATASAACPGGMVAVVHGPDRTVEHRSRVAGCSFDTGVDDMTPMIQVGNDGALVVARSTGGVSRSTDQGRTWSSITVPPLANGDTHAGIHGFVHIDARSGRIFYSTSLGAASCGGLGAGTVVSFSDDGGLTWDGSTVGCGTWDWGKLVSAPAVPARGPDAYPSDLYFFGVGSRPASGQREVYRSTDGGETWTRKANLAAVTTEAGIGTAADDGTLYFDYPQVTWLDPDSTAGTIYPYDPADDCKMVLAVSEDHGETWRHEYLPDSQGCNAAYGQQRVAVDRAGNVYYVWTDDRDQQAYLVTSRDRGHHWSSRLNVTSPEATFSSPLIDVAAREPGHIAISYLGTTGETSPQWGPVPRGTALNGYLAESFDALAPTPRFTTAALNRPDDPMVLPGGSATEGSAYVAFAPDGRPWSVHVRHAPALWATGDLVVGTLRRPQRADGRATNAP